MELRHLEAAALWHVGKACDLLRWSNFEKNHRKLQDMYTEMRRHFHISDCLRAEHRRLSRKEWLVKHGAKDVSS